MSKLLEQINNAHRIQTTLGVLCDVRDGTHDTPARQTTGYPLITSKQIKGGSIEKTDYFISASDFIEVNKRSRVDQWDILLSMIGTVGEVLLVKEPPIFAIKNIGLIKTNKNITLSKYVYYYISSKKGQNLIKTYLSGTSQQFISLGKIRELEIQIPEQNENQEKIVSILSAYDSKIENNNKIIKNLELTAQAIFNEWFINFKFPRQGKIKMIDSEMGKIPENWKVKKISDISDLNKGVSYTSNEINTEHRGISLINLGSFRRGGGFNLNGTKYFTGDYKESHTVKPGQILIAMTDLTSNREVIGHPARLPENFNEAVISLDVCSLVSTNDIYNEFIYSLMLRRDFSKLMASCASGTNVSHLNKNHIEGYEFVLPDEGLLVTFNNFVQPLFRKQAIIESQNMELKNTRDILLEKLI